MRVLVIEDDLRMASLLTQGLSEEGYQVASAHTGPDGLSIASGSPFDAIVLDVMLPGLDGFAVAESLRERGILSPILMLTARDTQGDIIRGLDLGADDYLTKPFDLDVFFARVRAVVRRGPSSTQVLLRAGPLEINTAAREVRVGGREVTLSRTEYAILELLVRRNGRVVTRDAILDEVWGWDRNVESNTLDAFIKLLRSKIDLETANSLVRTVRGVGYCLQAAGDPQ